MNLSGLRLLHRPKRATDAVSGAALVSVGECFVLETCQRRVMVTTAASHDSAAPVPPVDGCAGQWLVGAEAYCFLVELAAGLKSALVGESEILAQLKCAWSAAEDRGGATIAELRPWIQGVIADAKEVREQFLRGIGGQSYGSLLRHFTGEQVEGPVLLLGAGKLASSIFPYLPGRVISIWNRTPERSLALVDGARDRTRVQVEFLAPGLEAEIEAWRTAALVVVCVPPDETRDALRVQAVLRRSPAERPRVAHLGILGATDSVWSALHEPITLETLFALERHQAALRSQRMLQAHRWCESRARLRALDRCVSVAHGWEDLAGFAVGGAA